MDGFKKLGEGQEVTFEIGEDEKGRSVALEVKLEEEEQALMEEV